MLNVGRPLLAVSSHRLVLLGAGRFGAQGRTRTDTALRPADFKSAASTNSATPALPLRIRRHICNFLIFLKLTHIPMMSNIVYLNRRLLYIG